MGSSRASRGGFVGCFMMTTGYWSCFWVFCTIRETGGFYSGIMENCPIDSIDHIPSHPNIACRLYHTCCICSLKRALGVATGCRATVVLLCMPAFLVQVSGCVVSHTRSNVSTLAAKCYTPLACGFDCLPISLFYCISHNG